ncbi:MAG: hypothetical protein ASARMPRED_001858 [Alectoria sarmentosa]|nr:MAG: hypothetical protein ASARMPRED_001858 [Alectoria sarmentosa]
MSNTATSSFDSLTDNETTEGILGLGILVKLPREIRDEIYRYLVKRLYHINDPSIWIPRDMPIIIRTLLKELEKVDLDPNTLLLSKAINHEAAAVHYSESTFLCYLDYSKNIVCLLQVPIDRMMKIELKVYSGLQAILERLGKPDSENTKYHIETWATTIKRLNRTDLVRKIIHLKFDIHTSHVLQAVPSEMLHDLRTLIRYQTVIVELSVIFRNRDGRPSGNLADRSKCSGEVLILLTEAVNSDLEPALGPATFSHARPPIKVPGQTRYSSSLKFFPHEYTVTNSNSQVEQEQEQVELEMKEVCQEADGLDKGISMKAHE